MDSKIHTDPKAVRWEEPAEKSVHFDTDTKLCFSGGIHRKPTPHAKAIADANSEAFDRLIRSDRSSTEEDQPNERKSGENSSPPFKSPRIEQPKAEPLKQQIEQMSIKEELMR